MKLPDSDACAPFPDSPDTPAADTRAVGSSVGGCAIEAVLHAGPVCTLYRVACDALGPGPFVLKEFCPQSLCGRAADGSPQLRRLDSEPDRAAFAAGRAAFLDEAQLLARWHLPGLVPVLRVIDADAGPALLMPLLPGVTLADLPAPRDDVALHAQWKALLEPLAQLHAAGLVHGHLHARQLLWASGQGPVLLGFGLAARALGLAEAPQGLPAEAKPGSPAEPEGEPRPGPWTDVHALAAMLLHRLSGQPWEAAPGAEADAVSARLAQALGPARVAEQRRMLVQALAASLAASAPRRPAHAGMVNALLGGGPTGPRAGQPAAAGADRPADVPAGKPRTVRGAASHAGAAPAGEAPRAAGPGGFAPAFAAGGAMAMPHARDAFSLPALPRRGGERLRPMLLGLVLGLACASTGWWVRGLWLQEQEQHRIARLIADAAAPSAGVLPAWSTDAGAHLSLPDAGAQPLSPQPAVAQVAPVAEAAVLPPQAPTVPAVAEPQPQPLAAPAQVAAPPAAVAAVSSAPAVADKAVARPVRADAAPRRDEAGSRRVAAAGPARAPSSLRVGAGAPRAACGAYAKYALLQCMQQQCSQASWRRHPQCQRLLRDNEISS